MGRRNLRIEDFLNNIGDMVDSIWIIALKDYQVEILKDTMTGDLEGRVLDYGELSKKYMREFVYSPDIEQWMQNMSPEAVGRLARSGQGRIKFEMRFGNQLFGFEWHETVMSVLKDEGGRADRILLTSRNINDYRKAGIVEKAVESEYDYVVYIEADRNSYVMYNSNQETDTPVPPVASNDYEKQVAEFNSLHVPEEIRDSLTEKLSISYVQPILEAEGECITYCTVQENEVLRDKKLRFSYYDRSKNIWLLTRTDITDIREEKRQRELLQDALNAATVANRAKSEFLSRMSHDIRTPMNAIIGMTAIAGVNLYRPERVADCLEKISMSSKLLLSLINEVLDMSKIESGSIVLSEEEINLADLVQGVVTMIQPTIDQKGQAFEAHINAVDDEAVIGDMQRLQQLLLNLLSNAVKYTPQKGEILLEISQLPSGSPGIGCYEFVVADTGIGMKKEFLAKLFEPFERADDETIRAIQGTGLGMAISKNIVEMMDGSIQVESEYGKGSRFKVTLNLRLQGQDFPEVGILSDLPVLIVDDDEIICRNTCLRLEEIGMDPQWTLCGRDAVLKAAQAHSEGRDYFAVIIDLRMPEMDGIETTRQIRAQIGNEVPIIMISAYEWSEYEEQARQAGVNGFIMKPLFKSRLICTLKQLAGEQPQKPVINHHSLPEGHYPGRRVLLVEDNALNREIAVELLSPMGITVETAENGQIAVEKIAASEEYHYDLIFMDIQMPVLNGYEAAVSIRGMDRKDTKEIPIVAMTADAFAGDVKKSKDAGMNEHLPKPIDISELNRTLYRWFHGGVDQKLCKGDRHVREDVE